MDNTIEFFKDLIKENSKIQKESIKIQTSQLSALDEIKLALQTKPCLIDNIEKKINEGWKESTVKMYKNLIVVASSLFTVAVIAFIILAFGKEFIGQELTASIIKHLLQIP